MTLITDEMVEKAARALWGIRHAPKDWDAASWFTKHVFLESARTSITAVLPDLVEECAKVAERAKPPIPDGWHTDNSRRTCDEIAAAIRSLSTEQDQT